jgi:hypothetical protein
MRIDGHSNGGGQQPQFVLKVGIKGQQYHRRVGAAWRTKDGKGLNIKLDPGIALVGASDISITLWRNDEQQRQQPQQQQPPNHVHQDEDDIPF